MMEIGYEIESLYPLAGISKPYNQFELHELTSKVLNDLRLDYSDKRKILKHYAYYLVCTNFDKPHNYFEILNELRDIYNELDMDYEFQNLLLFIGQRIS
jgi:hypothetical protein